MLDRNSCKVLTRRIIQYCDTLRQQPSNFYDFRFLLYTNSNVHEYTSCYFTWAKKMQQLRTFPSPPPTQNTQFCVLMCVCVRSIPPRLAKVLNRRLHHNVKSYQRPFQLLKLPYSVPALFFGLFIFTICRTVCFGDVAFLPK